LQVGARFCVGFLGRQHNSGTATATNFARFPLQPGLGETLSAFGGKMALRILFFYE
jgi:hypothetical protein